MFPIAFLTGLILPHLLSDVLSLRQAESSLYVFWTLHFNHDIVLCRIASGVIRSAIMQIWNFCAKQNVHVILELLYVIKQLEW
jgi:hypothetical protein